MKITVVKIGGRAAADKEKTAALIRDMAADNEGTFVLVHGGGAEVTAAAKQFGIESQFVDGVRFTSMREMAVVDAVLAGKINKELVRQIRAAGLNGVGLSGSDGGLFTGIPIQPDSCTGKVTGTDIRLLHLLTENGYTPVIATTSMTADGFPLNINADEAALTLAAALKADQLIFISDIPGVLKNDRVLPSLNEAAIKKEISDGVISGGMIPKVKSALNAVKNGVGAVVIGGYEEAGDLLRLKTGTKGTAVTLS